MQNALLQPQQSIFCTVPQITPTLKEGDKALRREQAPALRVYRRGDSRIALNNTNVKGRVKTLPYKKRL